MNYNSLDPINTPTVEYAGILWPLYSVAVHGRLHGHGQRWHTKRSFALHWDVGDALPQTLNVDTDEEPDGELQAQVTFLAP